MSSGVEQPGSDGMTGPPSFESGDRKVEGRRSFLNWLLGGWMTAFMVSVIYPVLRYIVPPRVTGPATHSVTLPLKISEIKPNSGTIFKFGQKPGLLVLTEQGEFRAFSGICTHLDCTVQYRKDSQQIWCACHNGFYNLRGQNVSGPPPRPLEEFKVNLRDDEIVVSKMS
jgi:Rieske Fe-S protein